MNSRRHIWIKLPQIFIIVLLVGFDESVSAFEPRENLPVLKEMHVQVDVTKNVISGDFTYDYTFHNPSQNLGTVMSIAIDLTEKATRIWAFNNSIGFIDRRFEGFIDAFGDTHNEPPIVATSNLKSLGWWAYYGSVSVDWVTHGDHLNDPLVLSPGKTLNGFGFNSPAVPGITTVVIRPIFEPSRFYPDIHDVTEGVEAEESLMKQIREDNLHVRHVGRTLGPVAPAVELSEICDTFILDLVGQMHEASALGWIKHDLRKDRDDDDDPGKKKGDEKGKKKSSSAKAAEDRSHDKDDDDDLSSEERGAKEEGGDEDDSDLTDGEKKLPGAAKSVIKKLKKVRRECMRGRVDNAREKLRALIRQVNAQQGKHLTDEAYYLIKFNAEFLLEKI